MGDTILAITLCYIVLLLLTVSHVAVILLYVCGGFVRGGYNPRMMHLGPDWWWWGDGMQTFPVPRDPGLNSVT